MTKPSTFTPEQDATIIRMKAQGYGRADIAMAIGMEVTRTGKRADYLRTSIPRPGTPQTIGWPVHDPRKVNDWGKGFWDENVIERGTTPRMRQAPADYTIGGVARYG